MEVQSNKKYEMFKQSLKISLNSLNKIPSTMSCWGKDIETNQHKIYGEGNSLMNLMLPVLASLIHVRSKYGKTISVITRKLCYRKDDRPMRAI